MNASDERTLSLWMMQRVVFAPGKEKEGEQHGWIGLPLLPAESSPGANHANWRGCIEPMARQSGSADLSLHDGRVSPARAVHVSNQSQRA